MPLPSDFQLTLNIRLALGIRFTSNITSLILYTQLEVL